MAGWNTEFHNISVECTDKLVRIKNDEALIKFLGDPKTKGALLLADYAKKLYKKEIGRELKITKDSLAIEILGHVFLDDFAKFASKLKIKKFEAVLEDIKKWTEVIDCGESDIDSNRHIWDDFEEKKLAGMIYALCGKNA